MLDVLVSVVGRDGRAVLTPTVVLALTQFIVRIRGGEEITYSPMISCGSWPSSLLGIVFVLLESFTQISPGVRDTVSVVTGGVTEVDCPLGPENFLPGSPTGRATSVTSLLLEIPLGLLRTLALKVLDFPLLGSLLLTR